MPSVGGGLSALHAFGQGAAASGPFSATAARQGYMPHPPGAPQPRETPQFQPGVRGGFGPGGAFPPAAAASAILAAGGTIPAPDLPGSFRPLAPEAPAQRQRQQSARMVREWLEHYALAARVDPTWGLQFWRFIGQWQAGGGVIDQAVLALLSAHGYVGPHTQGAPRVAALVGALKGLEGASTATHGLGAFQPAASSSVLEGAAGERWNNSLPPDFQRAGGEIYRSIRHSGVASVREWLTQNFVGARTSQQFVDLWTAATAVDFRLSQGGSSAGIANILSEDDMVELNLRRLASYVYQTRTKDARGAAQMLGTLPPGSGSDLAPTWLVSEATMHSKNEHQRDERVHQADVRHRKKGDDKGKGKGKGKKGKDHGAAGAVAPA